MGAPKYGLTVTVACSFEEAIARVEAALKEEGFGVLTEIDIQQTLHDKIGLVMEPYTILGVCNPTLASRSIVVEPKIGLLLPCNVLAAKRGDTVELSVQDPLLMVRLTGNEELESVAQEARERVDRALAALGG